MASSARAYEEISELRFWLRDAIILRWALADRCLYTGATLTNAGDLERCVQSDLPRIATDLRASFQSYFQTAELPAERSQPVSGLFRIMETSHARLQDAGVAVWTPSQ